MIAMSLRSCSTDIPKANRPLRLHPVLDATCTCLRAIVADSDRTLSRRDERLNSKNSIQRLTWSYTMESLPRVLYQSLGIHAAHGGAMRKEAVSELKRRSAVLLFKCLYSRFHDMPLWICKSYLYTKTPLWHGIFVNALACAVYLQIAFKAVH